MEGVLIDTNVFVAAGFNCRRRLTHIYMWLRGYSFTTAGTGVSGVNGGRRLCHSVACS